MPVSLARFTNALPTLASSRTRPFFDLSPAVPSSHPPSATPPLPSHIPWRLFHKDECFSVPAYVSQEWYLGHMLVMERPSHAACHTPSSILPVFRAPLGETAHLSDSVTTGAVWDRVYFCPPLHCQVSYKLQMASPGKVGECDPILCF